MEHFDKDCISVLEQLNLQEKQPRHKRRWLLGLPASRKAAGKDEGSKFQVGRPIPEYLLREDDVSYVTIKSFVEKGCGRCNTKMKYKVVQDEMQLINSPRDVRGLMSLIDDMTNQGLVQFAEVLTGGPVKFEKTRRKMKEFIKECLSEIFSKHKKTWQINLPENYLSLFKNPHNFCRSSESLLIPDSDSYQVAVHTILNLLEGFPTLTLSAMHRKLRGTKNYVPQLIPKKCGWGRDSLIKSLRKKCLRLLTKLNKGDPLQEPLAKAMEVAALNLKLIQGCRYVTHFVHVSPEMNILQDKIAMCIQLIDQRLKSSALKDIQVLLDPKAKSPDRKLRVLVKNVLTEYLFECSDMNNVPHCLQKVIAIITRSSEAPSKQLVETNIEEELECILSMSASVKQVLWDSTPGHEIDMQFADAYMEDLEDNDDVDDDDDDDDDDIYEDIELEEDMESSVSCNTFEKVSNTGDNSNSVGNLTKPRSLDFSEAIHSEDIHSIRYQLVRLRNTEPVNAISPKDTNDQEGFPLLEKAQAPVSSNVSSPERSLTFNNPSMCKNQYLAVQAASDEASMVAYRLIGRMLDEFAQIEGCELNSSDMFYLGARSYMKQKEGKDCFLVSEVLKFYSLNRLFSNEEVEIASSEADSHKEPASRKVDSCSIFVKAVEELVPSFAECETARLNELMGQASVKAIGT